MMNSRNLSDAVPLSLSSMAHMTIPLSDGVVDGLRQILQHTLLSCVNYARKVHRTHEWTLLDFTTSPHAWSPVKTEDPPRDLPWALSRLGFKHQYPRHAWIYFKPGMKKMPTQEEEAENLKDWTDKPHVMGRVSLLYASQELLTEEELEGNESEDVPPLVLYKVVMEYRSLPATGSQQAVQAEELSMLSFGGSVDDDVKLGALASLYDESAKYVLEIYSVRGKKYKFDLMDSSLSDGTIPRLSSASGLDPFVKSLSVTVTEHESNDGMDDVDDGKEQKEKDKSAVSKIHLTMDGNLRRGKDSYESLPAYDSVVNKLRNAFLIMQTPPPAMATSSPSGQTLLLDPDQAGKLYINGRYVFTWGQDVKIGSHFPALFGMDLHSVPFWSGRVMDFDVLKRIYGNMWQEILTDARLTPLDIGKKLLYRLLSGKDPQEEKDAADDDDDEEDEDDDDDEPPPPEKIPDTDIECLESQVMVSKQFDPVGIAAKALATRFAQEFGRLAFPCLKHEVDWVKSRLPERKPVVIPLRLINVLRRGGYFSTKMTSDEVWFAESRPPKEDGDERKTVELAVKYLAEAGCTDVKETHVMFVDEIEEMDCVKSKAVCRYNEPLRQFHFNEAFLKQDPVLINGGKRKLDDEKESEKVAKRAFLMGMYIAQEHPDGTLLPRYLLRNQ